MRIIARLKTQAEVAKLSQLQVDAFSLDCEFSIKRIAKFTLDEIKTIVKEANKHGIDVYLNLNKMMHQADLLPLEDFLGKTKDLAIKAYVINDFTVFVIAKKLDLENKVIYQPGSMNTDSFSGKYLSDRNLLGMTISREVTLAEIQNIANNTKNLELSLIGHGYLDMFYSKRKLLTNYLKHKQLSGIEVINRHGFRLNEEIRPDDFYPILEDEISTMIFRSLKLISIDELSKLSEIIDDFFIERIFIDDEEYFDTIKLYKGLLNKADFMEKYQNFDSGFYYRTTDLLKGDQDES